MNRHILLVDDERQILDWLGFRLRKRGYEVTTARSERECTGAVFEKRPDLILMDIWLKGKLGTDLYDQLLRMGFDETVPVIFMTALVEAPPEGTVRRDGKYTLFGKPLDFEKLLQAVEKMIGPVPPLESTSFVRSEAEREGGFGNREGVV